MSLLEPIELPQPNPSAFLIGAASPLWAYFGAAAAGGVAFWWMTRWPQNFEAMFGGAAADIVTAQAAEVTPAALQAAVEAVEAPVGGEAAPVSVLVAATEPEPVVGPEPVDAAPDPAVEPEPRSVRLPRPRRPEAPLDA